MTQPTNAELIETMQEATREAQEAQRAASPGTIRERRQRRKGMAFARALEQLEQDGRR